MLKNYIMMDGYEQTFIEEMKWISNYLYEPEGFTKNNYYLLFEASGYLKQNPQTKWTNFELIKLSQFT